MIPLCSITGLIYNPDGSLSQGILLIDLVHGTSKDPDLVQRKRLTFRVRNGIAYRQENGVEIAGIKLLPTQDSSPATYYHVVEPSRETWDASLPIGTTISWAAFKLLGMLSNNPSYPSIADYIANYLANNPSVGSGDAVKSKTITVFRHGTNAAFAIPADQADYEHGLWIGTVFPTNFRSGRDFYYNPEAPDVATVEALATLAQRVTNLENAFTNGSFHFVHDQSAPASVWTIAHGAGIYPSVTVVDTDNKTIEGDVEFLDDNTVQVSFSAAFSGKAYLN